MYYCLSYCSVVVKKHRDQGNLYEKAFTLGLAYSLRRLVYDLHGGEPDCRQASRPDASESFYLIQKLEGQKDRETGNTVGFLSLKAYPHWHTSSNRPHFLVLPKVVHQVKNKHLNKWAFGAIVIQTTTDIILPVPDSHFLWCTLHVLHVRADV